MRNRELRVGEHNDFFDGVAAIEVETGCTVVYGRPPGKGDPETTAIAAE